MIHAYVMFIFGSMIIIALHALKRFEEPFELLMHAYRLTPLG